MLGVFVAPHCDSDTMIYEILLNPYERKLKGLRRPTCDGFILGF